VFQRVLLFALLMIGGGDLLAEPLRIAVASNFLAPAKSLAERFENTSGQKLAVSAGSTGKLYAQIVNGAPYDAFLAANVAEPARLESEGRAVLGSRFTYAVGRLILWSKDPALLRAGAGLDRVRRGAFERLAIANPRTAPYGAAAVQTMRALGLDPAALGPRLVRGENVSQTFQFASSGNVALGFVALSQVLHPGRPSEGSYWLVPSDLHDPIEQQAVLLAGAARDAPAKAFLAYLRSREARELIAAYGYGWD
jgi:molybdate transport system substrate-binding protein